MDCVKLYLGLLDLDGYLHLVVGLRHGLELADSVGGEAPSLGPVVQHEALGGLVIHEVGRGTDSIKAHQYKFIPFDHFPRNLG